MNNVKSLLLGILFFEYLLLFLTIITIRDKSYFVSEKDVAVFFELFFVLLFFSIFIYILYFQIKKIKRPIYIIPSFLLKKLTYMTIIVNILYFYNIDSNIRYIEGMVLSNLSLYSFKLLLNYTFMLIEIKKKNTKTICLFIWAGSYLLIADGLSVVLTLFLFLYLIIDSYKFKMLLFSIIPLFLSIGMYAKFGDNNIIQYDFLQWVVNRFTINTEQMYSYLFGDKFNNDILFFWLLIVDQWTYSYEKLFIGGYVTTNSFKTFSEFLYVSLYGQYNSGSSPGIFLSGLLLGGKYFGWTISFLALLPLLVFVNSLNRTISIFEGVCIYWVLKASTADFPGVIAILSFSFVLYFLTILFSWGGFIDD